MLSDRAVGIIAYAVTATWVLLNVVDAIPSLNYDVPYVVHGIMGLVAGSAFSERYIARKGKSERPAD